MKYRIIALIVLLPLIFWQVQSIFSKVDTEKEFDESTKPVMTKSLEDRKGFPRDRQKASSRDISPLASIKNEYVALMLPTSLEDLRIEELVDEENGAFYLHKAFEILNDSKNPVVQELVSVIDKRKAFEELSQEEKSRVAELLKDPVVLSLFDLAEVASRQENYNWKLNYTDGFELIMPQLSPLRKLQRIQNLKIEYLLSEGDDKAAVKALGVALKTGGMTSDGFTVIGELVQIANFGIISESLQKMDYDPEVYETLTHELYASHDRQLSTLDGERLLFGGFAFEKLRSVDRDEFLDLLLEDEEKEWVSQVTPESLDKDQAYYLEAQLKIRQLMEEPNEHTFDKIREISQELKGNKHESPISSVIMPSLEGAFKKYHFHQASLKMNMITMKLKEYRDNNGAYPDSLEQLGLGQDVIKDTLSSSNFSYQKDGESISLSPKTDFGKLLKGKSLKVTLN